MCESFEVQSSQKKYEVLFGDWRGALCGKLTREDYLLVDRKISILYPEIISLTKNIVIIEAKEESKEYTAVGVIMDRLLSAGFSRDGRLIAIGGGVVQDVVSFAASVLLRGVPWVFVPTSLLSQCDSCIGSKTSVNLRNFKNQLGGFYPPDKVFVDPNFCSTLSKADILSGFGEMLHYFLIDGRIQIDDLAIEFRTAENSLDALTNLIYRSLLIKRHLIELDEFDRGPRLVFNYGHTFGHAIESVTNYSVPHGIAVAYGMDLANYISVEVGLVDVKFRNIVRCLLSNIWRETPIPEFDIVLYITALKRDKKNSNGQLRPILTRGLGNMFQSSITFDDRFEEIVGRFFSKKLYESDI